MFIGKGCVQELVFHANKAIEAFRKPVVITENERWQIKRDEKGLIFDFT